MRLWRAKSHAKARRARRARRAARDERAATIDQVQTVRSVVRLSRTLWRRESGARRRASSAKRSLVSHGVSDRSRIRSCTALSRTVVCTDEPPAAVHRSSSTTAQFSFASRMSLWVFNSVHATECLAVTARLTLPLSHRDRSGTSEGRGYQLITYYVVQ